VAAAHMSTEAAHMSTDAAIPVKSDLPSKETYVHGKRHKEDLQRNI